MAKPKSSAPVASTGYKVRKKAKGPANYCRYCTAKIPRGTRKFCNAKHQAAYNG